MDLTKQEEILSRQLREITSKIDGVRKTLDVIDAEYSNVGPLNRVNRRLLSRLDARHTKAKKRFSALEKEGVEILGRLKELGVGINER